MHRQRIQHFIRDDHPVEIFRQCGEPFDPGCQFGQALFDRALLALGELGTDVQDEIAPRKAIEIAQFAQAPPSPARPSPRPVPACRPRYGQEALRSAAPASCRTTVKLPGRSRNRRRRRVWRHRRRSSLVPGAYSARSMKRAKSIQPPAESISLRMDSLSLSLWRRASSDGSGRSGLRKRVGKAGA